MPTIIAGCHEFTLEIANEVLRDKLGENIVSVDVKPLGAGVGIMSSIARVVLQLESGVSKNVVVKCVAQNENSEISKGLNFYSTEISFYQSLAAHSPIQSPTCLYAAIEPETQEFLLVLEDLGSEAAGDQLQACSGSELTAAFTSAGQLHAKFWNQTEQFEWLVSQRNLESIAFKRDVIYLPSIERTLALFPRHFNDKLAELVMRVGEQYLDLFQRAMCGPQTVIHGDYRIDNMFLYDAAGQTNIVAVDWQNTSSGCGVHDLAYFSSQSVGNDLRGEIEIAALREYYDVLTAGGVTEYSFEECLECYRLNLLVTFITPLAVCGTLDSGNERGMKLGETMLSRSLSALTSMHCEELLSE